MDIFEQEKIDGLEHFFSSAKASATYVAEVKPNLSLDIEALKKKYSSASVHDTDELFPIKTCLVSVAWNGNDDVFLKDEVWFARKTPEDKPINFQHDELNIIGHMTSNTCVDNDGKEISDDTPIDKLPDTYHILTDGVLYKTWKDEAKKKIIKETIDRINANKGKVSMECYFTGFDYAIIKDNKQYIIARNQETAFLTKFLKIYGGSGVYDGCRIGRALRNISFSGKGIVYDPANPNSIIITESHPFKGTASNINDVLDNKQKEIKVMSEDIKILESQVNELKKTISTLEAKNADLIKSIAEVDIKALKNELEVTKAEIVAKTAEITELKGKITAGETLVNEFKTKLEASQKEISEKADELNKIKQEQVKSSRIDKLVKAGLALEAASARYEKFASLSDEMFDEVVALVKPENNEKEKELSAGSVVDNAEKEKEAALAAKIEAERTKAEKVQTELADFARQVLNKKAK